ncbi:MAG: hypothetical protein RIR36_202, partial [Bacteroidota bacterium]
DAEQAAWKKFVTEKNLKNWIHAYQTKAAKEADEKRAGLIIDSFMIFIKHQLFIY